eukprot:6741591-Prymnesium_polylepis.2
MTQPTGAPRGAAACNETRGAVRLEDRVARRRSPVGSCRACRLAARPAPLSVGCWSPDGSSRMISSSLSGYCITVCVRREN